MSNHLEKQGRTLVDNQYDITPIAYKSKRPLLKNWTTAACEYDKWVKRYSKAGVGVLTNITPAIDIDVHDKDIVNRVIKWCYENIGAAPVRVGNRPKQGPTIHSLWYSPGHR